MNETPYYLGGYKIIKLKPINLGILKDKVSHTCSRCINFSVFDTWCQSWTKDESSPQEIKELNLDDKKIKEIREWTDSRFDNIANIFLDLKTAKEFKNLFLDNVPDLNIYSLNFSEKDTNLLIEEFAEGNHTNDYNFNNGDFGLRKNLLQKTFENDNEEFIGFDLIGVECDGSFHSFLCNDASKELCEKFSLNFNEYGLFEKIDNPDEVREFLNTSENDFEPLPYYICKVKKA